MSGTDSNLQQFKRASGWISQKSRSSSGDEFDEPRSPFISISQEYPNPTEFIQNLIASQSQASPRSSQKASQAFSTQSSITPSPRDFKKNIYLTQDVFNAELLTDQTIEFHDLQSIEPNDSIFIVPIEIQGSINKHPMFVIDSDLLNYSPIISSSDFCSRPGGVSGSYAATSMSNRINSGVICIIITRPHADGTFTNFLVAFATIKIEIAHHPYILNIEVICSKKYTLLGLMLWEYIKWLSFQHGIREIRLEAVDGAIPTYIGWEFTYMNPTNILQTNSNLQDTLGNYGLENLNGLTPMRYFIKAHEPEPGPPPEGVVWSKVGLGRDPDPDALENNTILYGRFTSSRIEPTDSIDHLPFNIKYSKHVGKPTHHPSVIERNIKAHPVEKAVSVTVDKPLNQSVFEYGNVLEALEFTHGKGIQIKKYKNQIVQLNKQIQNSKKHIQEYKKKIRESMKQTRRKKTKKTQKRKSQKKRYK